MSDEPLASATVKIEPDLDAFEEDLKAKLDEIMADVTSSVKIDPDLDDFSEKVKTEVNESMADVDASIHVTLNQDELDPELGEVKAKVDAATANAMTFTPKIDQSELDAGLADALSKEEILDHLGKGKSSESASEAQQLAVSLSEAALSESEFVTSIADSVPAMIAAAQSTDGFVSSLEGMAAPIEAAMVDFEALQGRLTTGGSTSGLVNSLAWGTAGATDPAAMQTLSDLDKALALIDEMDSSGAKVNEGFQQWGLGLATVNGPLEQAKKETEEMTENVDKWSATIQNVQGLLKDSSQMGSFSPLGAAPANVAINEFVANQQAVAYATQQAGAAMEAFEAGAITYDEALQQMVMTGMPVEKAIKDLSGSITKMKGDLMDAAPKAGLFSGVVNDLGNALTAIPADITSMLDGVLAADLGLTDFGEGLDGVLSTFNDFNQATITAEEALQSFLGLGIDTETAFKLLDEAGVTAEEAFQIFENGAIDAEQLGQLFIAMGLDATTAARVIGMAAEDIEGAIEVVETYLSDAGGMVGALSSALGSIGSGGEKAVGLIGKLGPMAGIVGLITAAILVAIPIVGELIGVVGALAAIGFTAFAGVGALALGAKADLGQLEDAAKKAFASYQAAVAPLAQPIVNAAIPIIGKSLNDLIPVAQAAAPAVKNVVDELNTDMSSTGFKTFVEWVSANTGPAITTISKFGGSVVESLAEMGENGQPFINMVEHGIDSLGTDLQNFGKSNTFKDFVNWLVANGPTVGGEIEDLGVDIGHMLTSLTPTGLTLLSDFVSLLNGLTHTVNGVKDVYDVFNHLFGSGGELWMAPAVLENVTAALDKNGDSISAAKSKASDLRGVLSLLKASYDEGRLTASQYGVAVDETTNALVGTEGTIGTYNENLKELNKQYGLGKGGADDLAAALGVNLDKALSNQQLISFGVAMNEVGTQSAATESSVYKLGTTTDSVTKNMATAANNAETATTKAWASFGDAITSFSNATVPPAAIAIENFYSGASKQAEQFSNDAKQAIKDGYDPAVISQALQAGPGQATQFLQGLVNAGNTAVSGQGQQLETTMKKSLDIISQEGEQAVQMARLTALAVAAPTEKIAAALPEAQALYLDQTTMSSAKAVQAVMTQYKLTLPQVAQIAGEYGDAIPKAVQNKVIAAGLAASGQANAVVGSVGQLSSMLAPIASAVGSSIPDSINLSTPAARTAAAGQAAAALGPLAGLLASVTPSTDAAAAALPNSLTKSKGAASNAAIDVITTVTGPLGGLITNFSQTGVKANTALATGLTGGSLAAAGASARDLLINGLSDNGTNKKIADTAKAVAQAAHDGIAKVNFQDVGETMASGIAKGINNNAALISKALVSVVNTAKTNAEGHIQKGSPSRLFANEIGMPIGQGVAQGMANTAVLSSISAAAAKIVNTALAGMQGHSAAVNAGLHITTTASSGIPSSVSVLGTGSNSFAGASGQSGSAIHYNPQYTISGGADPTTVNKWKNMLEQHDNELLEKIRAR